MHNDPYDPVDQRLLQTVRGFQPEIVAFCSRLVQIPSVNGVHDEIDVAQAIAEQALNRFILTSLLMDLGQWLEHSIGLLNFFGHTLLHAAQPIT